jgi:hypothetical protein
MMAVLVLLLNCPISALSVLTVHLERVRGLPLPNGPADARSMPSVCDPRWSMLSSSSSIVLLYILGSALL